MIKGVFMDNEKEKTIEPFELDDKDKELIELIRHMEGALYLPDECTVELHAFDDSEEAEKYIRDM